MVYKYKWRETDRQIDRDRYPVRLRLSEVETVRDRIQETQQHGFINKCYIIFILSFRLGDDIESCNYAKTCGFWLFFYSFGRVDNLWSRDSS